MNVGILGGGQLALMLSVSAKKLGLKPLCLGPSDCPAYYASETTENIKKLLDYSQLLTIENEFLDTTYLVDTKVLKPDLQAIYIFSNKLEQKKLLTRLNLPTAKYEEKPINTSSKSWIEHLQSEFPQGAVLKWGKMGYDGLGTYFLKKENISDAIHFVDQADQKNIPIYAEEMISFDKELALVTACSIDQKNFYYFPLVETIQANGVCRSVYSFEDGLDLSKDAQSYAKKLALASSGLVGVFAIEFFLKDKKLLINEIAPRVHNSGHWSQNMALSQFEAHWRALLGWPFPEVKYPKYFGMHNILSCQKDVDDGKTVLDMQGHLSLYWYGKKQPSPRRLGRKLGHINFASNDKKEFEHIDRLAYLTSHKLGY